MAPSIIEKYELILAADPRSRVFVELARALLDRGDHARAIEVCRLGLEHHPSSIMGRVTWGRALLLAGDARAAQDQFDIAIGIDPANPYAYNLVGEALVKAGLCREALPILTRAVELQPADPKAKAALDDARRRASGGTVTAMAAVTMAEAPGAPAAAAPPPTEPTGPASAPAPEAAAPAAAKPSPAHPSRATRIGLPALVDAELLPPAEPPPRPAPPPAPHDSEKTEELTLRLSLDETADHQEEQLSLGALEAEDAPPLPPPPTTTAAPAPPPVLQRAKKGPPGPRTLLTMIPPDGVGAAPPVPAPVAAPAAKDAAEAARVALAYEQELREKAAHAAALAVKPPSRTGALLAGVALVAVLGAAAGAYLYFDGKTRTQAAQQSLAAARFGLARDTKGSLEAAAKDLEAALARPPSADLKAQLTSLQAQVAATLAADFGDAAQRQLALRLADDAGSGDGGLVARLLLSEKPADRAVAEATVLAARPGDAPLLQRLAGQLLLARGEVESGRGRLRFATETKPPLLGAFCDLGDSYLAGGDAEAALQEYEQALSGQATHPRAVLGAAEARLALRLPLDETRQAMLAVENEKGNASQPPRAVQRRWAIAYARVLARTGDALEASRRLTLAAGELGASAELEEARAGLLLEARAFEQAEEAAARAVRIDGRNPELRVTLARALVGLHRLPAAIQALAGFDGRNVWLLRGIAFAEAGQYAQARAALERTAQGKSGRAGKMTPEAATWLALSDLGLGRTDQALSLLEKLAGARNADALVLAAHGRALLQAKRPDEAEAACRRAVEKDGRSPEGPRCLGRVLLAGGKTEEAAAALERAVALDPADPEAARLLAQAKAPKGAPAKRPAGKPAPKRR